MHVRGIRFHVRRVVVALKRVPIVPAHGRGRTHAIVQRQRCCGLQHRKSWQQQSEHRPDLESHYQSPHGHLLAVIRLFPCQFISTIGSK